MMFNRPRPLDASSRLWRLDEPQSDNSADGPLVLIRSVIALAYRHKISLIACTLLGLALAAIYARSLPPTYTSTATLLPNRANPRFPDRNRSSRGSTSTAPTASCRRSAPNGCFPPCLKVWV